MLKISGDFPHLVAKYGREAAVACAAASQLTPEAADVQAFYHARLNFELTRLNRIEESLGRAATTLAEIEAEAGSAIAVSDLTQR